VNAVWIIGIVIAVIVVIAAVIMMRRPSDREETRAQPEPQRGAEEVAARTPGRSEPQAEVVEAPSDVRTPAPPTPAAAEEGGEDASPATAPAAEEAVAPPDQEVAERPAEEPAPPPQKPRLSEDEIRSRVESQIADSERMLEELKAAGAAEEGSEPSGPAGMMEIMQDGLKEVRTLLKRKEWHQARDKGEALHAQLALMLQSARREESS